MYAMSWKLIILFNVMAFLDYAEILR
jgi:hypothetical protein